MEQIIKMITEDFPHIHAISINRHGQAFLSRYFHGHQQNTLFPIGCIFKSFLSTLLGIALKESVIESVKTPVINYYPEVNKEDLDPRFLELTIEHALTKTTGLNWPGPHEAIPLASNMQEVFAMTCKDTPGTTFEYKPDPQIIVYLLEDLYKKEIVTLAKDKLLDPLNIKHFKWNKENIQDMQIAMEDLSVLGELYLHQGTYKDTSYFPKDYFEASIHPYSSGGFPVQKPYGYYWWIFEHQKISYYCACGFGGQILCVIPALDTVITIFSKMNGGHVENHAIVRNIINYLT